MKAFFVLVFVLGFTGEIFSQQVSGRLLDREGKPVSYATVQLMSTDTVETISYTLSNGEGIFKLTPLNSGEFLVVTRHVTFESKYLNLKWQLGQESFDFGNLELNRKEVLLQELVIDAPKAALDQKGDTISYNLDLFLTGREQYLKDIINALPGMSIDNQGVIMANGRQVSELLVDGENLFGNNHKLITDNLRSDMVDGIDIIHDYTRNQVIEGINSSEEIALNVSIKEDAKGKFTGEANFVGAVNQRYGLGGSAFRFMPKSKTVIVGNINNLNETLFSNRDLIEYQNGVKGFRDETSLSLGKSTPGLPDFLKNNSRVAGRNLQFTAIGWTRPISEKTKIRTQLILNNQNEVELFRNHRTIINSEESLSFSENLQNDYQRFLGNGLIVLERKNGKKSHLEISTILRLNRLKQREQITSASTSQNQLFDFKNLGKTQYLGQQWDHFLRLKSNLILSNEFFIERDFTNNKIGIISDRSLYDLETTSLNQNQINQSTHAGLKSTLTYTLKNAILEGGISAVANKSQVNFNMLEIIDERINLSTFQLATGIFLMNGRTKKLQYRIGSEVSLVKLNEEKDLQSSDQQILFLPKVEMRYEFTKFTRLSSFYNRTFSIPNVNYLLTSLRVNDFRNVYQDSEIFFNDISIQEKIGMQFLFVDLYSGTTAYLFGNFHKRNNIITSENSFSLDFNTMTFTLGQEEDRTTLAAGFETKLGFIPFIFKTANTLYKMNSINFLEGTPNPFQVNSLNSNFSLRSFGMWEELNFETGIEFNRSTTLFDFQDAENNFFSYSPYLAFDGELGSNFFWSLKYAYSHFNTNALVRNLNVLDIQLRYKIKDYPWEIGLVGIDLLNIGASEFLQATAKGNQFQQLVFSRIPGYLGVRINLKF